MEPYSTPEAKQQHVSRHEDVVYRAEILLGAGKSYFAVVKMLQDSGMTAEQARAKAGPVYESAREQLMRNQLPTIVLSRVMIVLGFVLFLTGVLVSLWLLLVAFAALSGGFKMRSSVVRPRPLSLQGL